MKKKEGILFQKVKKSVLQKRLTKIIISLGFIFMFLFIIRLSKENTNYENELQELKSPETIIFNKDVINTANKLFLESFPKEYASCLYFINKEGVKNYVGKIEEVEYIEQNRNNVSFESCEYADGMIHSHTVNSKYQQEPSSIDWEAYIHSNYKIECIQYGESLINCYTLKKYKFNIKEIGK